MVPAALRSDRTEIRDRLPDEEMRVWIDRETKLLYDRRALTRTMHDSSPIDFPRSPCINVCTLSDDERFCVGCYRTPVEIAVWSGLDDRMKRAVLDACARRRRSQDRSPPASSRRSQTRA